jgi:hypothetical protein
MRLQQRGQTVEFGQHSALGRHRNGLRPQASEQRLHVPQYCVDHAMVPVEFRQHGPQLRKPLREDRKGTGVLAGVVAAQRRAERQAVRPQLSWPLAPAVRVGIDVLPEPGQLIAQPDVHLDQLVAEGRDPSARFGGSFHDCPMITNDCRFCSRSANDRRLRWVSLWKRSERIVLSSPGALT